MHWGEKEGRWRLKGRLVPTAPVSAFIDTLPFAQCVSEEVTFARGLAPFVTEGVLWVLAEHKLTNGKEALG